MTDDARTARDSRAVEGTTVVVRGARTARALEGALEDLGARFDYLTTSRGAPLRGDAVLEDECTVHARVRVRGGHCQVPCGIFDDPGMVAQLREASATIRKAMTQINELASGLSDPVKLNQSMRWVMTKEEKGRYEGMFPQYDKNGDGVIAAGEAVALFTRSGLDRLALKKVFVHFSRG